MPQKETRRDRRRVRERLMRDAAIPTAREFAAELIKIAGGPGRLARLIWAEFQAEGCPPLLKAKVVELFMRSLKDAARDNKPFDPSDLTDEELEEFLDERIKRVAGDDGDTDAKQ